MPSPSATTLWSEPRSARGYPLPHPEHLLEHDALRLAQALRLIDADLSAQQRAQHAHAQHSSAQQRRLHLRALHQMGF